jgi:acyl carrier protein
MSEKMTELHKVFQDELGIPAFDHDAEEALANIPGWDSVSMACVVLGVEKRFGVTFTSEEMDNIETVGDFLHIIDRKTPG